MCEYVLRSAAAVAVDNVFFFSELCFTLHRSFSFASFFFAILYLPVNLTTSTIRREQLYSNISLVILAVDLKPIALASQPFFLLSRFHASHWSRLPSAHRFCVFISLKFNESTTKSVIVFNAVQNICMDTHQTRCIELLATMNERLLFLFISCFCIYSFFSW